MSDSTNISTSVSSSTTSPEEIDENLQSRQLAVYGKHAMGRLRSCNVLISGVNGLGAEIAKNVILANVRSVTLHDTHACTAADLGSHFYLRESDIGSNRAHATVKSMQELNPSVSVSALDGELTLQQLSNFQVVVLIESSLEFALAANDFCRTHQPRPIAFIRTDINGLVGRAFTDFGPEFVVHDVTGEPPKSAIVANILPSGYVSCVEEDRLDFEDGDMVTFSEVRGMVELNDNVPRKVTNVKAHTFEIDGGLGGAYSPYVSGGIVTQVKVPKTLSFRSLSATLDDAGDLLLADLSKFGRPELLHALYRALDAFRAKHHDELPRVAHAQDAEEFAALARPFISAVADADDAAVQSVAREFAFGSRAVLNPMAALFGGIVGQEVVKAATGKFHPLFQHFYLDSFECLNTAEAPSADDRQPIGSRYDAQIIAFGRTFQERLGALRYFLVGAGALGCEFIKNMALMGVACGKDGLVTVTDDDTIEKSNLSRQFLFRNWHIGKHKSAVAAAAAVDMNPSFHVRAMQDRVSTTTEDVFNDEFWHSLNGVCNALDNIKARRYVDSRCVFFGKPLLESGTLGTKCNTQVVLPHDTEHYGASTDPPEKVTPDCTLHNFPHNIQHCLSWARSEFIGNFESTPTEVAAFLESKGQYVDALRKAGNGEGDILEKVSRVVDAFAARPTAFEHCIEWARMRFEEYFVNRIKQLTFTFPQDAVNPSGLPFWAPPKRFPTPLVFSSDDPEHMRFIVAAANLRARSFQIAAPTDTAAAAAAPEGVDPGNRDLEYFRRVLATVSVPEFQPRSDVKIKVDEKDQPQQQRQAAAAAPSADELDTTIARLPSFDQVADVRASPDEFEKDDDWNFHMDFIGSVGNLRARNYEITESDPLHAKLIAGRIIPAIATTTAVATGLVMLELYKIVNNKKVGSWDRVGDYRNAYINLALPLYSFSDPNPPAKIVTRTERRYPDPINHPEYFEEEEVVAYPEGHTVWDRIDVHLGDCTLREFKDYFKSKHNLTLCSLSVTMPDSRAAMFYHAAMKHTHARLDTKISQLYSDVGKATLTTPYIIPSCYFNNDDMIDVDVPTIVWHMNTNTSTSSSS